MSISKPIRIRYVWDETNFERAFEAAYRYRFVHSYARYIGWVLIAMTQFGVVALFKAGSEALLLFSTPLVLYWYWGKKALIKHRSRKAFEKSAYRNKIVSLEASEAGIVQEGERIGWDEVERIVDENGDILLISKRQSHYIPQSAFESLEEKNRFKSIAKSEGKLDA